VEDIVNKPVTITLTDGVERNLRYSLGSCRRLKSKFGASVFTGEGLKGLDEEKLPALLFEGLRDSDGNTPEGMTEEKLADLMAMPMLPKMLAAFVAAWSGSMRKNGESSSPIQTQIPATTEPEKVN